MSSWVRAALFALLVVLLIAGPVTAKQAGPGFQSPVDPVGTSDPFPISVESGSAVADSTQQSPMEASGTTFHINLKPNGDARWTVTMNFSLSTSSQRNAFDDFATKFTDGQFELSVLTAVRKAGADANKSINRSMTITNVKRTKAVHNNTGQLMLQFTWTNFSRQSGELLHVDDVFNTTRGTWLPGLREHQQLVISPPPRHTIVDATPAGYSVSSGSLRWEGTREFESGELSATYRSVSQTTTTARNTTPPKAGGFPWTTAGLLIAGVSIAAVIAYLISSRGNGPEQTPVSSSDDNSNGSGTPVADGSTTANAASGEPTDADTPPPEDDAAVDDELLSDEERVERLLERNGGRMKQANIVKETGWSNAKVSQLLSAMDENDRIDKLRIGRENLILFPDEDVTDLNDDS